MSTRQGNFRRHPHKCHGPKATQVSIAGTRGCWVGGAHNVPGQGGASKSTSPHWMMEHTHMRCSSLQTKNAICPSAFGKRYQMTIWLPTPPAAKLMIVTSSQLHSRHATIMVWSQLHETGEHTLVDQIRLCPMTQALHVDWCSLHKHHR